MGTLIPKGRRTAFRAEGELAHGIAAHLDAMSVVKPPFENAVGGGGIDDLFVRSALRLAVPQIWGPGSKSAILRIGVSCQPR